MSSTGFTPEQKAIALFRDWYKCAMCGAPAREVNHRANRGHGGFRAANVLSNACAICWLCNGLLEDRGSDSTEFGRLAVDRGVKLSRYDDPRTVEYFHPGYRMRVLLLDSGDFMFA